MPDTSLTPQPEEISLLMIEENGGDVAGFVGCEVEVRCPFTGKVKYKGQMTGYDEKNGLIIIDGEKQAHYRESFAV
jgi:putative DNA primase/helicase